MEDLPIYIREIIERLEGQGYRAYLVGGAVRDYLMGKEPKDYDITTDCRPEEVERIFSDKKTILVGKRFGTINIVNRGRHVEVTTFRTEGAYRDGRRPEEVEFSKSLEEDLKRRDFTINALAYNPAEGIIDLFGGRKDLGEGLIRTVGDPLERFKEDHLRILRAVRFSTRLEFKIEQGTEDAIRRSRARVGEVSCERIREEFFKMILIDRPSDSIRLLESLGLLDIILPELDRLQGFDQKNPNHTMDVYDHSLCVMDRTEPILDLRLAALFHDIGKWTSFSLDEAGVGHFYGHNQESGRMAEKILKRWNTSKKVTENVVNLIHYHMNSKDPIKKSGLKRLLRKLGEDQIFNLFSLQLADTRCSNEREEDLRMIEERWLEVEGILEEDETYDKRGLRLDGGDLIGLGYKEGREIGQILDYLLEEVLEDEEKNERESLIELALNKFPL